MKTHLPSFSTKIHCSFYFFIRFPDAISELPSIVNIFMLHLISIMDALESRDMDEVNSEADLLLQLADDILELATAYMDFVHPIYLDIQRHGTFDEEKITQLKSKLMDTLVQNRNKIKKEFEKLTKPRITEE